MTVAIRQTLPWKSGKGLKGILATLKATITIGKNIMLFRMSLL